MLKLTYTKIGLHMERVVAPLEVLIAQRVVLAIRAGHPLYVEPGKASFLLPADAPTLPHLEMALVMDPTGTITITSVDQEFVEVSVEGSWIADSVEAHEGMFITTFSERAEYFVYKLWQTTQAHTSSFA